MDDFEHNNILLLMLNGRYKYSLFFKFYNVHVKKKKTRDVPIKMVKKILSFKGINLNLIRNLVRQLQQ